MINMLLPPSQKKVGKAGQRAVGVQGQPPVKVHMTAFQLLFTAVHCVQQFELLCITAVDAG